MFFLSNGNIVLTVKEIRQPDFYKYLLYEQDLSDKEKVKLERLLNQEKNSPLKILTDDFSFSSKKVWSILMNFIHFKLIPCFDWAEGNFILSPGQLPKTSEILLKFSLLDLIRQGIYSIKNKSIIQQHLPGENETLDIAPLENPEQYSGEMQEKYILSLIQSHKTVGQLRSVSQLSINESLRILFLLINTGVVKYSENKSLQLKEHTSYQVDVANIICSFNEKFNYIFKYLSKEVGPVASKIVEKSIQETKPNLPPLFSNLQFTPEGKLELNRHLKGNIGFINDEKLPDLIEGLNEILVSLIFSVKRTLGNEHESALVKNLLSVGKWS